MEPGKFTSNCSGAVRRRATNLGRGYEDPHLAAVQKQESPGRPVQVLGAVFRRCHSAIGTRSMRTINDVTTTNAGHRRSHPPSPADPDQDFKDVGAGRRNIGVRASKI